jgi:hypothetical protein
VVGRQNYYGSHAEWAAHLAARVWTITATAERNHREPLEYLTAYLNASAQDSDRLLTVTTIPKRTMSRSQHPTQFRSGPRHALPQDHRILT